MAVLRARVSVCFQGPSGDRVTDAGTDGAATRIERLTPQTIGRIAAGEVVERPASVVKELVENALDAQASRISIEVRGSGSELIRVVDDGMGISRDDLPMAVERHATSKLRSFHEIEGVRTLGFRGEALASVASVASLTIDSRQRPDPAGWQPVVDFGERHPLVATSTQIGTTVEVRDLFGNVPARRQFLKQPSTELGAIQRVVAGYAAARPQIAFDLTSDGRQLVSTSGSGDLIDAAAGVHGSELAADVLLIEPVDEAAAVPGVSVDGWICGPRQHRSHRQQMVLFVNGRPVQHKALAYVVDEAFHTLLMVGRHPVTLHRITVDPHLVDINVHPTKAEVRFVDERQVARAVRRATHQTLAGAPREELPRVTFSFPDRAEAPSLTQSVFAPVAARASVGAMDEERPVQQDEPAMPVLRVLGQVAATYIIAEGPNGLYLIDQHAAHERVVYETVRRQMQSGAPDRQPFLEPIVVELDPVEEAILERSQEELRAIGFDLDSLGGQTWMVRAVPAAMAGVDIRTRLHLILQELAEGGAGESWQDSVAISAACHTSIRAGQTLTIPEMRSLIQELEKTEHPRACGHGRPTMLLMSQGDLERQFSRR